ncbi:MAG: site-specific integrase [Treponema sp.]|jgi:integrase|nr:site-specific integrase [Treponema sp.]
MVLPFSVFLRGKRPYYYVAFKNEETGRYLPAISTKKIKEADAVKQAWVWFREGVPSNGGSVDLKVAFLRDTIRQADISTNDAEFIIGDLKRRGLILSCVYSGAPDSVRFADYLNEFRNWEHSPYIREKLRAEHSIHRNYVNGMIGDVKKYWIPFFPSVLLGELSPNDIERFVDHLSDIKNKKERSISNIRKNGIIRAGTIPLRWAYRKGKIGQDITRGIILFSGKSTERPILTPQLAASIFNHEWSDEHSKVANMTAMVTGLRAGELQGLRAGDLGDGCLLVRHSWNRFDKLKPTKNNRDRVAELPFPLVLQSLKYIASLNPHGAGDNSYVFWASLSANKPMEQKLFIKGLRKSLIMSGLNETAACGFSFHGWRHFFTTYMRDKIEDKLLQFQTGHKAIAMPHHYSDHILPGDRDKIRDAQVELFSSLLPSG